MSNETKDVERLAPEDSEHLQELLRQRDMAQIAAQAAVDGFVSYLQKKYKLGQADNLAKDGTITRAPAPEPENK